MNYAGTSMVLDLKLACGLSPAFALIFVALRYYVAHHILGVFHRDDWLILAALILSIGLSICICLMTQWGLGVHYIDSPKKSVRSLLVVAVIPVAITGNLATLLTKVSILDFYLRFAVSFRCKIVTYIVIFVVVVYNILGAFQFLWACKPMHSFWDISVKERSCMNADAWYGFLVITNSITDGIILIMPLWIIYPLRVPFAQKAAIALILAGGGLIVGISIFRVYIVSRGFNNTDYTYKFAVNYFWSVVETNVAIVFACLPCLKPLFSRFLPDLASPRDTPTLYTIPVSLVAQNHRPPTRDNEDGGLPSTADPTIADEKSDCSTRTPSGSGPESAGSERASWKRAVEND